MASGRWIDGHDAGRCSYDVTATVTDTAGNSDKAEQPSWWIPKSAQTVTTPPKR
ncbi:hypothetical protein [Vibrio vulnificus]|uniref:hypothetical protein n=1 Tax=Vibrio vulnificus TaxID=672 RepID=UPI00165DE8BC|nr:hypothetical protein [Vibrio vulnificus]